jgi:nucleoside-diphosphate-sugar epimerase
MNVLNEQEALSLMRAFKGVARRVVVPSSQDVYLSYGKLIQADSGPADPSLMREDSPLRASRYPHRGRTTGQNSEQDKILYDYDKIPVERAVLSDPDLPGTVLRLPMVYGPNDHKHRTLADLKKMRQGESTIGIDERMFNWRWTRGYVENVAHAIAIGSTDERAQRQIYNVGESPALSQADWVHAIGRAAKWKGDIVPVSKDQLEEQIPDCAWENHLAADTSKISRELGYTGVVDFEEGMRRTIEWEEKSRE